MFVGVCTFSVLTCQLMCLLSLLHCHLRVGAVLSPTPPQVCIIEYFECFCLCTAWLIGQLTFKRSHSGENVRQNTTNTIASYIRSILLVPENGKLSVMVEGGTNAN